MEAGDLCQGIAAHGHKNVIFLDDAGTVVSRVKELLAPGDLLLTLGAGDVWKVGEQVLEKLTADGV